MGFGRPSPFFCLRCDRIKPLQNKHTVTVAYLGVYFLIFAEKTGVYHFYIKVQGKKGNEGVCVAVFDQNKTRARHIGHFFYAYTGVITTEKYGVFVLFFKIFGKI